MPSLENREDSPNAYSRIVVKIGTSVLTGGGYELDRSHMVELVRQCSFLQSRGCSIVICTSAAVAVGRALLKFPSLPNNIASKQLLAAVGQTQLMQTWEQLFNIYNVQVGQVLLTRSDVEERGRYINARDVLSALVEHHIIPVVNENDAIATEEIKVGDNDNLSALVATLLSADLLIMLTDQPGLFTADPRDHPDAELIPEVRKIDDSLKKLAGSTRSGIGVGGMATKLQAADMARRAGADVVIASGRATNVILRAAAGQSVGTRFLALDSRLESRKRWLLAGPMPSGRIRVDDGAVRALSTQGKSLLPAGIVTVNGKFSRGDIVVVVDTQQSVLARGVTAYSFDELKQIMGCRSDQIAERLGYTYGPTVIHRNDMVLLIE